MYKTNMLYHTKAIQKCLPRFNLRSRLDLSDFRLTLRGRNRYYEFVPQFIGLGRNGGLQYMPVLREEAEGFIGWLPYFNKRWPLAADKLLFKAFCIEQGVATPRHWMQPADSLRNFIIKGKSSSFGQGIRGPFQTHDPLDADQRLRDNEYYEQFIAGAIAKAWYWDEKLVCLEMLEMPMVTGDGKRSLYELIVANTPGRDSRARLERSPFQALARYQGFSLDDVVPNGKRAIADFRYVSPLFPKSAENTNVLAAYEGTEVIKQFSAAGRVLWRGIPENIRNRTLWTMDAMVEKDAGRVSFLEMNCNPIVHPDAYFSIFETLFGAAQPVATPSQLSVRPGGVMSSDGHGVPLNGSPPPSPVRRMHPPSDAGTAPHLRPVAKKTP